MRMCPYLISFIVFSISLFSNLFAAYVTSADVPQVMEQLFTYHIDQKKMTPPLVKRSVKIYLQNFDSERSYLVENEVKQYTDPSDRVVEKILSEYQNKNYRTFFEINEIIAASIGRARGWREEWRASPQELLAQAKVVVLKDSSDKKVPFASKIEEAKMRHHEFFLKLIAVNMKKLNEKHYLGKEDRLIALADKQLRLVEDGFLGIDDQGRPLNAEGKENQVILKMLKATAASLDAHTAYYSPEEALSMRTQLAKGMCGIGVVLQEGVEGIMVAELVKGGPADRSGLLKSGDTITKVDQVDVKGASFPHILELMRGKEGTDLSLQLAREGEKVDVRITRAQITLDDKRVDVTSEPFGDGIIGKITLHSFYEGADGITSELDLKRAITELRKEGPLHGLVLDLRENGGGFLTQAVKVSGLFMKSGVVVISKYSGDNVKYYRTFNKVKYYDGPLVVLISRGSASAAEILAQTLQDYGVALVVGDEQSYGKGTIQHQTVTDDKAKAFFKVTIGRYYTVSGRSTQIDGVKSDIFVPTKLQFEEMGESFLEYPLETDKVASAYSDNLSDVDPQVKKWFQRHYTAGLQGKSEQWMPHVAVLRENSKQRLAKDENYKSFLQSVKGECGDVYGKCDLQMVESVNIVKDMILLDKKAS